ncbi:MAG: aldo/keto reductase [Solobacterium sp.]|nr:aldo/keto reductase [Solobacterium sp.]
MSSIKTRIIELHNGTKMPSLGYRIDTDNKDKISLSVKNAVSAGFRHFDFPADPQIEKTAATALRESGVPRYELFLTLKLADENHGYNRALRAFDQSLKHIGSDYADMFLINWPDPVQYRDRYEEISMETWKALEEIYKSGKAHAIGFANFHAQHIEHILAKSEIAPMFNQARIYPGCPFTENLDCADKHKIQTEGFLPAAHDAILNSDELKIFAKKYRTTPRNICIRYLFEKGCVALCQGTEKEELLYAWNAYDLKFEKEDMIYLDAMRNYGPKENSPEK